MRRTVAIAALALAVVGCTLSRDASRLDATIVAPGNFLAGSGIVVAVSPLAGSGGLYRVSVQLDTKGFQAIDVDRNTFLVGQAVAITNDGRIEHVSGTTFNR